MTVLITSVMTLGKSVNLSGTRALICKIGIINLISRQRAGLDKRSILLMIDYSVTWGPSVWTKA